MRGASHAYRITATCTATTKRTPRLPSRMTAIFSSSSWMLCLSQQQIVCSPRPTICVYCRTKSDQLDVAQVVQSLFYSLLLWVSVRLSCDYIAKTEPATIINLNSSFVSFRICLAILVILSILLPSKPTDSQAATVS